MNFFRATTLLFIALSVSSCSKPLGSLLGVDAPDEFAVVTRDPLEAPPHFRLNPPKHETEMNTQGYATATIPDDIANAQTVLEQSTEEQLLVRRLKKRHAYTSKIRHEVDAETQQVIEDAKGPFDSLIFWRRKTGHGATIDPFEEKRRLDKYRKNQEHLSKGVRENDRRTDLPADAL